MIRRHLVLPFLASLAVAGCAGNLPLADLNADPGRYNEQTVRVKGEVTQTFGIPALKQSVVRISDGTGAVWAKPRGRVAFEGETIEIQGVVKIGMTIANREFAVLLIEEEEE